MRHFWNSVVRPVLEVMNPSSIVEIGAARGHNTRRLAGHCRESGTVLHVIDPAPRFDAEVEALVREDGVVMHTDLSLNVLRDLPAVDVALVDGDHNWYTVFHELRLLQDAARRVNRPTPVAICHDVCWPYGRRDLYYDPSTIPAEFRQPWARQGIVRGESALAVEGGVMRGACNATSEGGPRNGVMTAIEDFVAQAGEPISVEVLQEQFGIGLLVPHSRIAAHPGLDATVARVTTARPAKPKGARRKKARRATSPSELPANGVAASSRGPRPDNEIEGRGKKKRSGARVREVQRGDSLELGAADSAKSHETTSSTRGSSASPSSTSRSARSKSSG
jgi:hypothetical protein